MGQAMMRFGGLVLCAALVATPASAQFLFKKAPAAGSGTTRDQVRLRLLDQCVMSQSGKTAEEGAGPKCGCYAVKISKAMTDEEVATYKKGVPNRLTAESTATLAGCK
jgi:hypothetical protein